MRAEMVVAFGAVLLLLLVTLKIHYETGEMLLWEHLRHDWTCRISFRFFNNRYRGLSRTCYRMLLPFYYAIKAIVLLALCVIYYTFFGLFILKWKREDLK